MSSPSPRTRSPHNSPLPTPPMHKSRQFTRTRDLHSTRIRKTFRLSAVIFFTAIITFLLLTPWQQLPYPNGPRFTGAFSGVLKPGINHQPNKWKPVRLGGSPVGIVVPGTVADHEAFSHSVGDEALKSAVEVAEGAQNDGLHAARVGSQVEHDAKGHLAPAFEQGAGEVEKDLVGASGGEGNQGAPRLVGVDDVSGSGRTTADEFEREEKDLMTGAEGKGEVGGNAMGEDNVRASKSDDKEPEGGSSWEFEKDLVSGSDGKRAVGGAGLGEEKVSPSTSENSAEAPVRKEQVREEGSGWEVEKDLVSGSDGKGAAGGAGLGEEKVWPSTSENSAEDPVRKEQVREEGSGWEVEKDLVSGSDGKRAGGGAGLGEEKVWPSTSENSAEEPSRKEQMKEEGSGWEVEKDLVSGSDDKKTAEGAAMGASEERAAEGGEWIVEKDVMRGSDDKGTVGGAAPKGKKNLMGEAAVKMEEPHGEREKDMVANSKMKMMNRVGQEVEEDVASSSGDARAGVGKKVASGAEKTKEGAIAGKAEERMKTEVGGKKEDKVGVEVERDLMSGFKEKKVEAGRDGVKSVNSEKVATEEEGGGPQYKTGPLSGQRGECKGHIMYDKPVKTGSSAVTVALRKFLESKGQKYEHCSFDTCLEPARAVCGGRREKIHFVQHISAEEGLLECLGRVGYYRVTSIREPLDRWESSFLYNRGQQANHYGIAFNESFGTFMALYPDCSLHDYYDGLGKMCVHGKLGVEERVRRIVGRYEEIIDLYDEDEGEGAQHGQLRKLLAKDVAEVNRSKRPDGDFREWFDEGRLAAEKKLYEAFKKRQRELVGKEPKLCIG